MKKRTKSLLEKLVDAKHNNLKMLVEWSFEDLHELHNRFYEATKDYDSEVLREKISQVSEAIEIKRGNEEQAWDFLS
jgi:hypothetical protein